MNDMERQKFEDSFQDAFKDAEVTPSDNVWTNVELDLERAEGGKMKRRLFFYQTLAAASVTFALCVAGIGYYLFSDNDQNTLISQEVKSQQTTIEGSLENKNADKNKKGSDEQKDSDVPANSVTEKKLENPAPKLPDEGEGQQLPQTLSANKISDQSLTTQDSKLTNKKGPTKSNPADYDQLSVINQQVARNDESKKLSESDGTDNLSVRTPIENSSLNPPAKDRSNEGVTNIFKEESAILPTENNSAKGNAEVVTSHVTPRNISNSKTTKLPSFYEPKNPELQLPVTTADPGALLLARLADEERKYSIQDKKKAKDGSEKLWTSVGFAAGGFNSPNPSVSPAANFSTMATNSSNVAAKQSKASGLAYSVGVSIGANLSDRWVLQGGVNYLTQSSDYTADNVIVTDNTFQDLQAESINAYNNSKLGDASQSRVAQTFPYKVNNNVQFVSVPLQAGYMVLNKKFGFQLNAGISTDLFLQNTITPDGGGLTKTTQSRGDDSPYRSLNFSGLMGTELSYKLGSRYRLALNPGLRYPLNSVYKSDTGVQATPLTFDVGLRFRYIFH